MVIIYAAAVILAFWAWFSMPRHVRGALLAYASWAACLAVLAGLVLGGATAFRSAFQDPSSSWGDR